MAGWMSLALFAAIGMALMAGYPVAFTLAGVALIFAAIGSLLGSFDPAFLGALPNRIFGIMTNETLIAVPVFVFMGVMLERSRVAEQLLESMSRLAHRLPAGLGLSVILVGAMMAASTGIVGATVVTMGLISLPTMLHRGYHPSVATGTISMSSVSIYSPARGGRPGKPAAPKLSASLTKSGLCRSEQITRPSNHSFCWRCTLV